MFLMQYTIRSTITAGGRTSPKNNIISGTLLPLPKITKGKSLAAYVKAAIKATIMAEYTMTLLLTVRFSPLFFYV